MTRITLHDDDGPSVDGVFLPLDVSAVPDAVVARVVKAMVNAERDCYLTDLAEGAVQEIAARDAIAALAAALGEVSDG
jgi:hypothetical protein